MSAMVTMILAAAAVQAPAEAPSVAMDVARARVEMVKSLLASAGSGNAAALEAISGPGANANINGAIAPLAPAALAPLGSCSRSGPFTVSEYGVMLKMACNGSLPADATVLVTFAEEKIVSVVAGPSAPALAVGDSAQ